jgi:hypothetical protein
METKMSNVDFSGSWAKEDGMRVDIRQDGELLIGTSPNEAPGYKHFLHGFVRGNRALAEVERRNPANQMTVMYMVLQMIDANHFRQNTTGSDGKADLPVDFTEKFVYQRL